MIFAVKALRKSILLIVQNFRAALFLTGSIYLAYVLLGALLSIAFTGSFSVEMVEYGVSKDAETAFNGGNIFHGLALAVFAVIAFALMAIRWHRFILIDEVMDPPPITASLVFDYIIQSLIVGFLVCLALIPFVIVIAPFALISPVLFQFLMIAVVSIAGFWLLQRSSMVLPAVAIGDSSIGKRMWSHTSAISFEIFIMGLLFSICSIAAAALLGLVNESIGGPIAFAVLHIFNWLGFLINVSILTTLYGHLFQRRALD